MDPSLDGCHAKMARAIEHIEQVKRDIAQNGEVLHSQKLGLGA
jgi:hypothetical protein